MHKHIMCHTYTHNNAATTSHGRRFDVPNITASQRPIPPERTEPRHPVWKTRGRTSRQKMPASTPEQERQNCEHADSTKRKRERNGNSGNKREKAAGKVAKLHRGFRVTRTVGEKPGQGVGRGESRERMSPSNHGDEAEHTQEGFTKTRQKSVTARSRRVRRDSLNLFKIFGDYETPIKPNAKIMPSYPINITD